MTDLPQGPQPIEDDPDGVRALVDAAKAGDMDALNTLVERHLPALRAFCRLKSDPKLRAREASSDLVQTACRQALQNLDSYEWQGAGSFRNWLFSFAMQKIRNKRQFHDADKRSASHEVHGGFDALRDSYGTLRTPSRVAIAREEIEALERVMDQLPEDYRDVIVLARIVGLGHSEIAARLGRSEGATRVLLSRALARLATLVSNEDDPESS